MSTPFNPNASVSASEFMTNLVTFYNDYWSDPAGSFSFDAQHTVDLDRRKGWGQDQVNVKGITETSVATGQLVEAEHLNSVIAQVNAGLQHIDNSLTLLGSVSQNALITASEVEAVRQQISGTIDTRKFEVGDDSSMITVIDDENNAVDPNDLSSLGTPWSEDLYIEYKYTFTDYNHARHFFNSGGELTIKLDMTNHNTPGNLIWDEIFESFGHIGIGAVNSQATQEAGDLYQAPNLIPNRGFYSITPSFTTLFETAGAYSVGDPGSGAYIYAFIQSAYNSRRIKVEGKGVDSSSGFDIIIRVSLLEDEDDNFPITGRISADIGYKIAELSPDNGTGDMNPYTGVPGSTQYRFQAIVDPTVTLTTTWTPDDLPDPVQVTWDAGDPGVNWTQTDTYTFDEL